MNRACAEQAARRPGCADQTAERACEEEEAGDVSSTGQRAREAAVAAKEPGSADCLSCDAKSHEDREAVAVRLREGPARKHDVAKNEPRGETRTPEENGA